LKEVDLPWHEEDWRGLSEEEQNQKLEEYVKQDRASPFDLSKPPLMRVSLIRRRDDTYMILWTRHHIIVDGWCSPIVFGRFIEGYKTLDAGNPIKYSERRKYRDYIQWIKEQDEQEAEKFWRGELSRYAESTPISSENSQRKEANHGQYRFSLSTGELDALKNFAKANQVTLNTVIQAAWSIVLSRYTQREDVVFGVTVSGRSMDLPGIEGMVGLFINTLPLGVKIDEFESIKSLLQTIQGKMAEINGYSHVSLAKVQTWSHVQSSDNLFDHILVFENYPTKVFSNQMAESKFSYITGVGAKPEYPLVIDIIPEKSLELVFTFRDDHLNIFQIEKISSYFYNVLLNFIKKGDQILFDISLYVHEKDIINLKEKSTKVG
ncbi:MAG: hypothetical protein K2X02_05895, partial [Alphaproteobacteria bacterium]|nr:hypothetical protein [Alphaproteobacteria bacterium]